MAGTIIKIKHSDVTAQPAPDALAHGELAYSFKSDSQRLFIGKTSGLTVDPVIIGGKYYTEMMEHTKGVLTASSAILVDANKHVDHLITGGLKLTTSGGTSQEVTSIVTDLSGTKYDYELPTALSVRSYLTSVYSPTITVRGDSATTDTVNLNSETFAVFGTASRISSTVGANSVTLDLITTAVTAGAYGSATAVGTFTVDAYGRLTLAQSIPISIPHTQVNDWDEAIQDAIGTKVVGGTGVAVSYDDVTTGSTTVSIGQPVGTSDSVTFANATLSGYLRGPSTFVIDPAGHGDISGTVVIAGNLQVDGTVTAVHSTTVTIDDKNIVLGNNATMVSELNGAGITIGPSLTGWVNAAFTYAYSNDRFYANKDIEAANFIGLASRATDVAGGDAGQLLYQSATGETTFLAAGTNGYFLYSNAGTPAWTNELDGGTF